VTSRGNALVHEMKEAGNADDPRQSTTIPSPCFISTRSPAPDPLLRRGKSAAHGGPQGSPDGKTVEFEFLDVAGSTQYGHMHHAMFTIIDANHHTEDWTFMMPETSRSTPTWTCSATK
jgi:hypothetical protein